MISSKPVRGTRDILPEEAKIRDRLEQQILAVYRAHGFSRIETPVMENLELLLGSDGGENLKMLFTVLKRGEKLNLNPDASVLDLCDMGLRFDLTLPLSRFYSNNQEVLETPFKAIQIGNVFRAERPQKGRFRAFKQCDIDIIGDPTVSAEIELIDTTAKALLAIGFSGFTIKVNHRQLLSEVIIKAGFAADQVGSVCISLDKMDKIGAAGVTGELLEKGHEQQKVNQLMACVTGINLDNLEKWVEDTASIGDLTQVISTVKTLAKEQFDVVFDFSLIRGMGYYTGLIFEVSYGPYGYSIAGGGRYDNMIGKYNKVSVPAVGFSIGFERIISILMEEQQDARQIDPAIILFYDAQINNMGAVIGAADCWRNEGYRVNLVAMKKKFGKQIAAWDNGQYEGFLVFGRDEEIKKF
ncbi:MULTISPECIES: histidine--tRNA ligase [unclassified Acetobacterium]|jgi:histidyl-tRNA synthetase|uniref:histidine--tRNA ligase n=1 Tax=unclassified Acetobacterium TaxID=2638182 RepID=UPI000DBEADCE|nr:MULTISPECIES: histidine--tRNA ligase [unclassified Acetobacterium]AWW26739.1 histidine--tRNA ligase [Acetobacterium sp. KB-1]MDZ5726751.1 histidine--tRNA ligase [Acetobacterium sp. K1/6]